MGVTAASITVVVPYYNEENNLTYLLTQLAGQTLPPHEVILVNSGSTDASSQIVDEWINAYRGGIRFRNLHASTSTPGGSKSAGVKHTTSNLLAFMDCGITFPNDWLQRQFAMLEKSQSDWVSGVCRTTGINLVDKSSIAHTYGYLSARPVIPGSLVRRKVFDQIGLFKDLRAGYDAEWARTSQRAGLTRTVNQEVVVEYRGVNFAANLRGVFLKSLRYARPSVRRDDTLVPFAYLAVVVIGSIGIATAVAGVIPKVLVGLVAVLYMLLRIAIAMRKSLTINYFLVSPVRLIVFLIVAAMMDLGKSFGFTQGIFMRFIQRREFQS